jgi:putative endonuclease
MTVHYHCAYPLFMRSHAFVYILRCADGTLYTGYTTDLERRLKQHQSGNGGKYTRTHTPVELVYAESFHTRRQAMQREAAIKRLPRKKKLALIESLMPRRKGTKKK